MLITNFKFEVEDMITDESINMFIEEIKKADDDTKKMLTILYPSKSYDFIDEEYIEDGIIITAKLLNIDYSTIQFK